MSKHQAGRLIIHLFLFSFLSFIFYDPLLPPPAPCHDARMKRGSNHEHAAIYFRGCTLPNLIAHSLSLSLSFSLFFLFFSFSSRFYTLSNVAHCRRESYSSAFGFDPSSTFVCLLFPSPSMRSFFRRFPLSSSLTPFCELVVSFSIASLLFLFYFSYSLPSRIKIERRYRRSDS